MKEECKECEEIHRQGLQSQPPKLTSAGKTVLAVGAGAAALIYGLTVPFLLPGFRKICLPFVPATEQQITNVIRCLRGRSGSIVDLGSGDGRILFSIMKQNVSKDSSLNISTADGVELNSWLVWYSKFTKWRLRNVIPRQSMNFYKRDIFKTDLRHYDNIVVFGVESLMVELEQKFKTELKNDGLIIACRFPLPNWKPVMEKGEGIDKVWSYDIFSSK